MGGAAGRHAAHPPAGRPRLAAGHQRADRPRRGGGRLPAAQPPPQPVHLGHAGPAARDVDVPRLDRAEGAVRHRRGGVGGGGQVDVRPHPAGAAVAVAGAPAGRPRHHRRLPAPERRARRARHHGSQGVPGELRHAGAARVPARGEERLTRGDRAGVRPRRLRHPPRRAGDRAPARHRHRRGAQRACR